MTNAGSQWDDRARAAALDAAPLNLPRVEVRGDRPLQDFIAKMEAAL